jgi:hypothetical protein
MKRRIRVAAASSLLALGALGLVACGGDDETTGSEETLTFTSLYEQMHLSLMGDRQGARLRYEDFNPQDLPPSPGSGFALSIPLADPSDVAETVGEINGTCIATRPGKGTCSGTADVPGGQLAFVVGGEVFGEVLASEPGEIVGGTGNYEGATGTFVSDPNPPTTETFNIILP